MTCSVYTNREPDPSPAVCKVFYFFAFVGTENTTTPHGPATIRLVRAMRAGAPLAGGPGRWCREPNATTKRPPRKSRRLREIRQAIAINIRPSSCKMGREGSTTGFAKTGPDVTDHLKRPADNDSSAEQQGGSSAPPLRPRLSLCAICANAFL
jgi:hypothetical protein